MSITAHERAALTRHARQIDEYERIEAAERQRLAAPHEARLAEIRELGTSDAGPTDNPSIRRSRGNTSAETMEGCQIIDVVNAGVAAFAATHRPLLKPWDTPEKLAEFIRGQEAHQTRMWEIRAAANLGPTTAEGKRDRDGQVRSDLCKKAYERLMGLAAVAPSIRADFPLSAMTDPDYVLPAIKAWCDEARCATAMAEVEMRYREEMSGSMIASLPSDESDEHRARREFRDADPLWKRVYADLDYQEALRRGLAAVLALPASSRSDPTAIMADPECRVYIDRKLEIESRYGVDQTHPWDRCDTPDSFARWLASRAIMVWEIVPFADHALANGPFDKPLLENAHAKAVDLAHISGMTPPKLPPRPPQTKAEGKAYLLELHAWVKQMMSKEESKPQGARDEALPKMPPPKAKKKTGQSPAFKPGDLAGTLGMSGDTLRAHAKAAGITALPAPGRSRFAYPLVDALRIAQRIENNSVTPAHRVAAQDFLSGHPLD